jgi:hypothetical protein
MMRRQWECREVPNVGVRSEFGAAAWMFVFFGQVSIVDKISISKISALQARNPGRFIWDSGPLSMPGFRRQTSRVSASFGI